MDKEKLLNLIIEYGDVRGEIGFYLGSTNGEIEFEKHNSFQEKRMKLTDEILKEVNKK